MRKELKRTLKAIYRITTEIGVEKGEQKDYVLSAIAGGLLSFYLEDKEYKSENYRTVYRDITGKTLESDFHPEVVSCINCFIEKYKTDAEIDSILSWAYQYSNGIFGNNIHSSTQFFTERYMVWYLINSIKKIGFSNKIVDPCCGGGNFLAECFEYLCLKEKDSLSAEKAILYAGRLYGYDIDSSITNIAVMNIRLRALSVLKKNGCKIGLAVWDKIRPNIFRSAGEDKTEGALSAGGKQVIHVLDGRVSTLSEAVWNADVVLTNPPFATVKGMDPMEKAFLKENYPDANCDTCVAFLEAVDRMLNRDGICGIVSQNAWMHLKSFKAARDEITSRYSIYRIVNLGSGAFADLSGEKSNVSLLVFSKKRGQENDVEVLDLGNCLFKDKIAGICGKPKYLKLRQKDMNGPDGYDFTEKGLLREICSSEEKYKDIAVPMQGTSTGNAKELVGYFWEHFGDTEWINVSKGGGYCRWQGLNNSVVKWGRDGEYIRAQRGSALRNTKYFSETQMVFSDTGTAGLNVRRLLKCQIFIASGPGIRVTKGNEYAHLALLNSRIAAYCLRMMSPKLTIAAGYIGQIPVKEKLYSSPVLEKKARLCVWLKQRILEKRPDNIEYNGSFFSNMPNDLDKAAWSVFNDDITNELLKLKTENEIDTLVIREYELSEDFRRQLESSVGKCAYQIDGERDIDISKLDKYIDKIIDADCSLKRTRASRNELGSDGLIEYISKDLDVNPEIIVKKIQGCHGEMRHVMKKYKDFVLHNMVMNCLGYNTDHGIAAESEEEEVVETYLENKLGAGTDYCRWLRDSFNSVHREIFRGVPYLIYQEGAIYKYADRVVG